MDRTIGWQARSFIVIGTIGFCIDGGILTMLNSVYGMELVPSRLVSFSVAVTVTWLLNRIRTFAHRADARPVREWGRYALVNGIGAMLNMTIFFWLVAQFDQLARVPLVPLGIAASIALIFNFFASKHVAFGHQQS